MIVVFSVPHMTSIFQGALGANRLRWSDYTLI
jgi:menaquinone-dependent protoporphyrinogen IX oxidase